jgi:Protein of unknown function (DUF1573)
MKKLIFSFAISLFTFAGFAQTHDDHSTQPVVQTTKPEIIKLYENSFDFGKIPQGKPVTHNFVIENISKDTLILENVQASCGCTTPEWSKSPILVAEKSTIKVGYNAASEGNFEKTITIYYNGGQTKQFTIKGIVWKTPDQSVPNNQALNIFKQ